MGVDRIMGLDPSSTATGWAIMSGGSGRSDRWTVTSGGVLRPRSRVPLRRIVELGDHIAELIRQADPDAIAIESTSGKVGGRHGGGGAGLATYGMAVGVVLWAAREVADPASVYAIPENTWTDGMPKATRSAKIRLQFPEIRAQLDEDRGGDLADAVGIACFLRGRMDWIGRSSLTAEDLELETMAAT